LTCQGRGRDRSSIKDDEILVWDALKGNIVFSIKWAADGGVYDCAFSPDGKIFAAITREGILKMWDLGRGKEEARIDLKTRMSNLEFSPDGRFLVVAEGPRAAGLHALIFLEVTTRKTKPLLKDEGDGEAIIRCFAFSPDGKVLAVGGTLVGWSLNVGRLKLWDVASGRGRRTLTFSRTITEVCFSGNGKRLAAVESKAPPPDVAHVWEVSTLLGEGAKGK
jgi:WD40 repeat protein